MLSLKRRDNQDILGIIKRARTLLNASIELCHCKANPKIKLQFTFIHYITLKIINEKRMHKPKIAF